MSKRRVIKIIRVNHEIANQSGWDLWMSGKKLDPDCPYRALAAEVIARAIRDILLDREEVLQHERRDAIQWIEDPDIDRLYSFKNLCEYLNLEYSLLRKTIMMEAYKMDGAVIDLSNFRRVWRGPRDE